MLSIIAVHNFFIAHSSHKFEIGNDIHHHLKSVDTFDTPLVGAAN